MYAGKYNQRSTWHRAHDARDPPPPPFLRYRARHKKGEMDRRYLDFMYNVPALRYHLKTSKKRGETKGITPPPVKQKCGRQMENACWRLGAADVRRLLAISPSSHLKLGHCLTGQRCPRTTTRVKMDLTSFRFLQALMAFRSWSTLAIVFNSAWSRMVHVDVENRNRFSRCRNALTDHSDGLR